MLAGCYGTPRSGSTRVGSGFGGRGWQGVLPVEGSREDVCAQCQVQLILRRDGGAEGQYDQWEIG
jgi:hypothetical protein